jgi:hypothetical protein
MKTDLDQELESTPEYRRTLAELSPDERLRLLGRDFDLNRELGKKREKRRSLARLSSAQKLRLLDELRIRAQLQRGDRRSPPPNPQPIPNDPGQGTHIKRARNNQTMRSSRSKARSNRFGGRATAGGVNYEVRVAAFIAVKMLGGESCSLWSEISGADISTINMQEPEPVDDIVVSLRGDAERRVFISAKERNGTIALTEKNPAFVETVDAFVRQFLKLSAAAREKSRLVWAIPSCVGRASTHTLLRVLDTHRKDAVDTPVSQFLLRRTAGEKKVLCSLLSVTREAWRKQSGSLPSDQELQCLLRHVYVEVYDFERGQRYEREVKDDIRSHIVADPKQARRVWEKLEHIFASANERGLSVTPGSLHRDLAADGLALKAPPGCAEDIERLRRLTTRNLTRLKEHTTLPFGSNPDDAEHIDRSEELSPLVAAVKSGHLLITGEPGCGKSGIIHTLVEALQKDGLPVLLLLAEDGLPDLDHPLEEILINWPSGARGFLITDALDAVRDPDAQRRLRALLRAVKEGESGWTVIASVREFDLKYGRELRAAFPGEGVAGHADTDFASVAHFHLGGLSEGQLDELAAQRAEIRPFIESARKSVRSEGVHRSPFYLRLATELLRDGAAPSRVADWNSPAVLLRKFWEARIEDGAEADEREVALEAICRRMVETRSMALSLKEISLDAPERRAVRAFRSRGILQAPALRHGTRVGDEEIRFTHHLLHDYAIARSLIPTTQARFCEFVVREPLLPVFYRQSFIFALEELWDAPDGRDAFWKSVLQFESAPRLHGVTRILGPILAARRVEALANLQPLLRTLDSANDYASPGQKALRHLASGLQDADPDAIRAGIDGWCAFAKQLASLLTAIGSLEQPLAFIIDRLNAVGGRIEAAQRLALNAAGRGLLARHVSKEVSKGWRYASRVAIETICRTFSVAPAASELSLLALLSPERLARFPHEDLFDFSHSIKHLGAEADAVVLRLFEAAFAAEPKPGEWETFGTAILPMRFQTSDQWNLIRYALAEYYETREGANAALMAEVACIAWNAVARQRRSSDEQLLATVQFRGFSCELVEDYSHIWGREFEHDENRILSHFEKLLREWAAAGDADRLNSALDRFSVRNRTALMWTVFMEAGAEYPSTLGILLKEALNEPLFFTHSDYCYAGTALLGALHRAGGVAQRESLEKLIFDLPKNAPLYEEENRQPVPPRLEHAQDRLLGVLEESNIVLGSVRDLWRERQTAKALAANPKPEGPRVLDQELVEQRGVSLEEPENKEVFRLREALKPFLNRDNNKLDAKEIDRHWPVIQRCERALKRHSKAEELWGHLVGACESIVRHASWPATSDRWKTVRRILLKAADDPVPEATDDPDTKEDRWPSWGWPSPRIDAALGLQFLAYRRGHADKAVSTALRRLSRDKSHPLRFNLARGLALLEQPSPELMWELIDAFVANEPKFSVLDVLLGPMGGLLRNSPAKAKQRLRLIAGRTMQSAPADNQIHETLAGTYLFEYLRTGESECKSYISALIADCDGEAASHALLAQLHKCGLKSGTQADAERGRTWSFFAQLLAAAQEKLNGHREALRKLHEQAQPDADAVKACEDKLNRVFLLVNGIATQLFFASGAREEKTSERIPTAQTRLFWQEAAPLLAKLAEEPHPHTAYQIVRTLNHLLPCAPREVFLLAAQSIRNSSEKSDFQYESLAVSEVVALIQRALADHRDIFQSDAGQASECLDVLLQVLDLFVEAGWSEARQLTHRLEEIYR